MNKDFDVVVTGSDSDGVQLITGVVNKALLDNGFTNVGVMSGITGEPTLVPDVPSLMDIVRHTNPGLFHQPVKIAGVVLPQGDVAEYVEKNADQLEKYPNAALTRHMVGSHFSALADEGDKIIEAAAKKAKEPPPPTAAELSEAAKTMSRAAHQNDHHSSTDVNEAKEKLEAKAVAAA